MLAGLSKLATLDFVSHIRSFSRCIPTGGLAVVCWCADMTAQAVLLPQHGPSPRV